MGNAYPHWRNPFRFSAVSHRLPRAQDRGPFIREHTATALNFQLTLIIAYAVGTVTSLIFIGVFVLLAAWVVSIVFGIIAAIAANKGEGYVYPLSIKFVS